jgi:hypothetical protein
MGPVIAGTGARWSFETSDSDDAWPVGITRAAWEGAREMNSSNAGATGSVNRKPGIS